MQDHGAGEAVGCLDSSFAVRGAVDLLHDFRGLVANTFGKAEILIGSGGVERSVLSSAVERVLVIDILDWCDIEDAVAEGAKSD